MMVVVVMMLYLYYYYYYDDDYYYIHTVGFWKRAPQTLVNAISTVVGEKKWTSYDNDYIYISGDLTRIPMSLFNRF